MQKISLYILPFLAFFLFVFAGVKTNRAKASFELTTKDTVFTAGHSISLRFKSVSNTATAQLFLIHSYAKIVVNAPNENGSFDFKLPLFFTEKTGVVNWFLISENEKTTSGTFKIKPNNQIPVRIETYLGPRTILTGTQNFTMMVVVPTDKLDNPKDDNTPLLIKDQFQKDITIEQKNTKDFIGWKRIYSRTKAGKLLASSQCENTTTKEIETDIYPSIATDFAIKYERNHDFADGNQITKLITNEIKDQYGNLVSDGTMVEFKILTDEGIYLKSYGNTINGVAIGQILHPDHKETYTIKAYVTGMGESKPIKIFYKPLIKSFEFYYSKKEKSFVVGPLKSFMNQIVPNGIKVVLRIYHNNKLLETKQQDTYDGKAKFYLSPSFYKEKEYDFEMKTLGITQKTNIKLNEIH